MTTRMDIDLTGEGAFADVKGKIIPSDGMLRIVGLADGMVGDDGTHRPSVAIGVWMPDGSVVLAQTSLALFLTAADALRARFGDPRE